MLVDAILQLENDVDRLASAEVDSTNWWLAQGAALSLSVLRTVRERKLSPVQAVELRKKLKQLATLED